MSADPNAMKKLKISLGIIIALFAFVLYSQSILFDFAMDDFTVIKDNNLVNKGIASIPTILKTDYWYGYNINSRGPIYRPTSLVLFAIIWQFAPNNPHIYHLINVLLYSISCLILFLVLCKLFSEKTGTNITMNLLFPFVCSILYTAHPIHTEVVANIKSLDEIFCFLFGISAILLFINYVVSKSYYAFTIAGICYFLSLISKETGVSFLIIIPSTLFVFTKMDNKEKWVIAVLLVVETSLYFLIRHQVLAGLDTTSCNIPINNSLLAAPDFITQKATAFYVLLKYILLLIFPNSLTTQYGYIQIPIMRISDLPAIAGIVLYFALGIYSIIYINKKNIIAFSILFYLITLAPVANIFLMISTTMAERFMYIPSLGFCMVITAILIKYSSNNIAVKGIESLKQFVIVYSKTLIILFCIIALYSFKTIERSMDWKDTTSIFSQDVKVSDNSAIAHYVYGRIILYEKYPKEQNISKKQAILDESINEFNRAISIYDAYDDPYWELGRAYNLKKDYINAIKIYEKGFQHFQNPPAKSYNELGYLYLKNNQFKEAITILDSAIKYDASNARNYYNKGAAIAGMGNNKDAVPMFLKSIELDPKSEDVYKNLGLIYGKLNDNSNALKYLNKAIEMDSADFNAVYYLGMIYHNIGDTAKANQCLAKVNRIKGIK